MGKHILEKNYHRLDPVGQSDQCKDCQTTCKTSCARHPAHNMGFDVPYIIGEKEDVVVDRFYDVTIKSVDGIPCDIKDQKLKYDVDGRRLEGEIEMPWPMNWIYEVIEDYLKRDSHLSGTKTEEFHNPDEDDQVIICEIESYIERK